MFYLFKKQKNKRRNNRNLNTYRLNLNKNFQKVKTKDCKTAAAAAAMTTLDRKKISEQDSSMKYPSKKTGFYSQKISLKNKYHLAGCLYIT